MEKLLIYLACHFLGDFAFQPDWMFRGKGESWLTNFFHAAVYTSVFVLLAKASAAAAAVLLVTHFWIDPLKVRWKVVKSISLDQLLHFAVIAAVLWFSL